MIIIDNHSKTNGCMSAPTKSKLARYEFIISGLERLSVTKLEMSPEIDRVTVNCFW